jgi:lipoprotein-anchoring transpeptidase ErfK/SrfK
MQHSVPAPSHRPAKRPATASPPKKRRVNTLLVTGVIGGVVLVAAMAAAAVLMLLVLGSAGRIADGVTVGGISVGGMTEVEAREALSGLSQGTIQVTDGTQTSIATLASLGIQPDLEYTTAAADAASAGTTLPAAYTIDLEQAQQGLVALAEASYIEATSERAGRAVDIPVVLDRLRVDVSGELADGVLDLAIIELPQLAASTVTPISYDGPRTSHTVQSGEELGLIARLYGVDMDAIVSLNGLSDPDLIFVGQELVIPAAGIYQPTAAQAPAPSTNVGRALVVSVSQQRLYAFENGQLVHSHLVSTGLPETPTVLGDYAVYVKYRATDMRGPDYYLPQVPWTMYFYQGYGIHGTYWHNNFGRRMSHGCVNLPIDQAEWFFNFASVGTPVRVVA